jgi:membrane complex biogenesis BtpA family protein
MASYKKNIAKHMGADKYVIACTHLIALPGAPAYDRAGGMKKIINKALRDTKILLDNGVHSILFVNEADIPYLDNLPIEGVAAFATIVNTVVSQLEIKIPYGINSIFDAAAGFAVANATGATFMRTTIVGVYATNYGLFSPKGPSFFRTRASLGYKQDEPPYLFNNIGNLAGNDLTGKDALAQAKSIAADDYAQPHAFAMSPENLDMVKSVKKATPDFPVVVAKGTNHDNVKQLMEVFDGTIMASCLHEGGKLFGQIDADRTKRFMDIFRTI